MVELVDTIQRMRIEHNFKQKHGDDGWDALLAMIENKERPEAIALRFSLSSSRVGKILEGILGTTYGKYLNEGVKQ